MATCKDCRFFGGVTHFSENDVVYMCNAYRNIIDVKDNFVIPKNCTCYKYKIRTPATSVVVKVGVGDWLEV